MVIARSVVFDKADTKIPLNPVEHWLSGRHFTNAMILVAPHARCATHDGHETESH